MRIDEERRREWLRALRRFKQGVHLRAKVGVIDTLCKQVAAERRGKTHWDAPQWEHERWVKELHFAIAHNVYPTSLLIGFVKTAEVTFFNARHQPTTEGVIAAVNLVCRQQSRRLRQAFGVFI